MPRPSLIALALVGGVALSPVAARPATFASVPATIAFTRAGNVYLMDSNGMAIRALTHDANPSSTGPAPFYPAYAWSPDGRYLALERDSIGAQASGASGGYSPAFLVLDSLGQVDHAAKVASTTWAMDADQTITTSLTFTPTRARNSLVNLSGITVTTWTSRTDPPPLACDQFSWAASDPAAQLYKSEVSNAGFPRTFQVLTKRHLAVFSDQHECTGTHLHAVDVRTGRGMPLTVAATNDPSAAISLSEGALNAAGALAAVNGDGEVVIIPHLGAPPIVVGVGALPAWSPDGRSVFYVQGDPPRAAQAEVTLHDAQGYVVRIAPAFHAVHIREANADGSDERTLYSAAVFGIGPLQPTSDGRSLVFSEIGSDNALLAQAERNRGIITRAMAKYYPTAGIARLDLGRDTVTTIAQNASDPQVRPE